MRYFIMGLIFTISPFLLLAHNPLSARYELNTGSNASLLTINLSQDGLSLALSKRYEIDAIQAMDQKAYEELIVAYIKEGFDLVINGEKWPLQKGGIKLGSHQTDLKFVLPAITEEITDAAISIESFKENENHQNIFYHNLLGARKHLILDKINNYRVENVLDPEDNSIERSPNRSYNWFLIFGSFIFVVLGIAIYLNRKK